MDRCLLLLSSFLLFAIEVSHAALPAQVYWHTVLPSTPMPVAIRDRLRPDDLVDESAGTTVHVGTVPSSDVDKTNYALATETQIHDDPDVALFFLEKDLRPGAKMNLYFTKTTSGTAFIPRRAADSIPFSTSKLPEVLSKFSIEPNSVDAEAMKQTLKNCEQPAAEGETKYCATSLESMVDFSTSTLGTRDVQAVSTEVGTRSAVKQEYTVAPSGPQRMPGSKLVACHAEAYAYAVFYCHATGKTRAYTVPLVGKDGTAVEAVAVCHIDTASWNPRHIAFQMLHVKPGTVPICHFLSPDAVVWTPIP